MIPQIHCTAIPVLGMGEVGESRVQGKPPLLRKATRDPVPKQPINRMHHTTGKESKDSIVNSFFYLVTHQKTSGF